MGGWGYREGRQARVTGKVEREVGQRKERKESKEGEEERGRGPGNMSSFLFWGKFR